MGHDERREPDIGETCLVCCGAGARFRVADDGDCVYSSMVCDACATGDPDVVWEAAEDVLAEEAAAYLDWHEHSDRS